MAQLNLTEEDIQFLESWYTPVEFAETVFHDFNNFTAYKKGKFGDVRLYQYPMLSDEPLIDFELTAEHHSMNKKEEFQLRKNVGDLYCFGARKYGKSKITQELDLLVYLITGELGKPIAFSSVDLVHLKQILDPVKNALGNHVILKKFVRKLKGAPDFNFLLKDNTVVNSVNFNLNSTTPGRQWFGKHVFRLYIEEASMESEEVYDKRKDALSELGAVQRHSGMTNFTPYSPAGKAFYKLENQRFVLNLPQYVNPFWDEKEKQDRIEEYGGEDTIGYKVFVKGELVEDGVTALDMKRIRDNCYLVDRKGNFKKKIKKFEITKDNFKFWRNLIVVQRPENAERIFISADVGARVTELVIHSEIGKDYEYIYNITLLNLTQQEKETIFKHVIRRLNANVIAIDCGDGEGRGIFSGFELEFPKSNLVYYDGSMKIKVGYEYEEDESGDKLIKMERGEPVYKYELMSTFSVKRLKDLLYNGRCKIPEDFKFDIQFSAVIETILGGQIKYKCISTQGDHLFDAWRVFFIAEWLKSSFDDSEIIESTDWGVGAVS
ncbi:MAG: hypothetical protein ACTSYF_02710 [Promethearchaeota archaeon]